MKCLKCGRRLTRKEKFCIVCGTKAGEKERLEHEIIKLDEKKVINPNTTYNAGHLSDKNVLDYTYNSKKNVEEFDLDLPDPNHEVIYTMPTKTPNNSSVLHKSIFQSKKFSYGCLLACIVLILYATLLKIESFKLSNNAEVQSSVYQTFTYDERKDVSVQDDNENLNRNSKYNTVDENISNNTDINAQKSESIIETTIKNDNVATTIENDNLLSNKVYVNTSEKIPDLNEDIIKSEVILSESEAFEDTQKMKESENDNVVVSDVSQNVVPDINVGEWVLNTNTQKFHYSYCSSIKQMKDYNRRDYSGTRESVINMGYTPCKRCNP